MKKRLILILTLILAFTVLFSASTESAASSAEPEIYLRAGTTPPATQIYNIALRHLAQLIDEYSNGRIKLDIFPDAQLGGDRDLVESVSMGFLEMTVVATTPIVLYSPDFAVFDLPYLITDREKAFAVMDGEVGRKILDTLLPKGIYAVDFWENGFRQLSNNVREVRTPADLEGLKIRVMESEMHVATFTAMGAYATPMSGGEIFTALQQRTVDGQDNGFSGTLASGFFEVQRYASNTQQFYSPCVLMINRALWDSFDAETQAILDRAFKETRDWQRNKNAELEAEAIEEIRSRGVLVYTDINHEEWAKLVQPVYDRFAANIPVEYIEAFR